MPLTQEIYNALNTRVDFSKFWLLSFEECFKKCDPHSHTLNHLGVKGGRFTVDSWTLPWTY